jgi:RNA polymerase sigma-70 factor, ECF subfamily
VRPDPVAEVETKEGAEDEQIVSTVERADLHAVIASLDERDRQLLMLRYGEDLTQQAIARRLGLPDGTVKVRLHRLRHKLRKAIQESREEGSQ